MGLFLLGRLVTRWWRASRPFLCGSCGALLELGDPYLELSSAGQRWRLHRCESCAVKTGYGQAPPDLDRSGLMTPRQLTSRMVAVGQVAQTFRKPEKKQIAAAIRKRA